MRLNRLSAIVGFIVLTVLSPTRAQQQASNVFRLEEEIARLSAIDRSIETPEELRRLNRSFLEERKSRLRLLLEQKVSALRDYRRVVSLSQSEGRQLDESIRRLERELSSLQDGLQAVSSSSSEPEVGIATFAPSSPELSSKPSKGKGNPDVVTIRVDNSVGGNLDNDIATLDSDGNTFDLHLGNLIDAKLPELKRVSISTPEDELKKDYYCVVHIVLWNGQKVGKDGWFLYKSPGTQKPTSGVYSWQRQEDFDGKRLYGTKAVGVLFLHVNAPVAGAATPGADITYKIAINKKTPAPVSNLMTLVGSIKASGAKGGPPPTDNLYAARVVAVEAIPSDLVFSASLAVEGQQSQELARTYDNEGRYYWDVSVGVPVKTMNELQFVSDGNKVTTAGKERQDVYGFLNVYVKAVDVKSDRFLTYPHFVFGVPLASKPLHHPFAGIGVGVYKAPIKFNLFAGVIFNRERVPRTLTEGSTATPSQLESDLRTRWVRKFTWGINFPISQIKDALK